MGILKTDCCFELKEESFKIKISYYPKMISFITNLINYTPKYTNEH